MIPTLSHSFSTSEKICVDNIIVSLLNYALIYNYAQQFIVGMMIYQILVADKSRKLILPIVNIVLAVVLNLFSRGLDYTVFLIIVFVVTLVVVINTKYHFYVISDKIVKILKPLSFLSMISYPVYLVHQNIGYAIIHALEKQGITTEFVIIIPIFISILLAYLLHKFVEIPSSKLLKKLMFKGK